MRHQMANIGAHEAHSEKIQPLLQSRFTVMKQSTHFTMVQKSFQCACVLSSFNKAMYFVQCPINGEENLKSDAANVLCKFSNLPECD